MAQKKNLDGQEKFNKYFQELNKGIKKTEEGNASLLDGIRKYKDESSKILLVGSALGEGAHKIEVGIEKMGTGISQISEGSDKLLLASNELNYAAKEIFLGTNLIYQHLPKHLQPLVGDAQGLSASVEIERESLSENASYGTAFTPYFVALSLWLGIVVSTFFFHYRKIRETSRNNPQWKKICIKLFFPSIMVIFQALLCCIGVIYWLHLTAQSMIAFVFISLQASLIFLCIIFSFILIFRDAGRLVALLFFVFQIASAGGAFPIEMSGAIYRIASPWLPFTNIVKAMRVAVLGAYNGSYALFLLKAWLVTGMLFIIANLISRWKYVSNSEYSLAIDI